MHLSNERLGRGSVGASPEQRTGHQIDEADAAFVFVDQVVTGTVVEAIVEREAKGRIVTGRVLDRHRWVLFVAFYKPPTARSQSTIRRRRPHG